MKTNQMKNRLVQLESRLKSIVFKHKEIHSKCFPKDGSDGVYAKTQKARSDFYDAHKEEYNGRTGEIFERDDMPIDFDQTPESIYMHRLSKISGVIRREMLAILYYLKIMETDQGINSLINNTADTINKYRYLFNERGKIDLTPLFPKTRDEIAREGLTRLDRMKAFPKEQNYSMFTQAGNLLVNDMMIKLIEFLRGESKIHGLDFQAALNTFIDNIANSGHDEVHDTAVREVVLGILEKEISATGYTFSIDM